MFRFRCSNCERRIKVSTAYAGKKGRCPFCAHTLTVPSPQQSRGPSPKASDAAVSQPLVSALDQPAAMFAANALIDPSLWLLLASNIIAIVWAIRENWPLSTILWSYWSQGVIIGVFFIFTTLALRHFNAAGFSCNKKPIECDPRGKTCLIIVFFITYGAPHAGFFFFLWYFFRPDQPSAIGTMAAVFFVQQAVSFLLQLRRGRNRTPDMRKMYWMPHAHVLTMYFSVASGALFFAALSSTAVLLVFLVLKTATDLAMEMVEKFTSFDTFIEHVKPKHIKEHLSSPPRKVSALIRMALMFSGKLADTGWLFCGLAFALVILSARDPALRLFFVFIPIAPLTLALAFWRGLKKARLLRKGDIALAEVVRVEKTSDRPSASVINYRFLAEDNSIHEVTIKSKDPKLLIADDYEILFYDPRKPSSLVFLDSLPADLYIDRTGDIRIGNPIAAALAIFSPKIMFFTCGAALNIIPVIVL